VKSEAVENFWKEYCEANSEISLDGSYQVWFFGNSSEMARELAELVLSGKKKATASLVAVNEIAPEIAPVDGGFSVVTDFEGNPQCIIQTIEVRHLPFMEVDAEFAFDEGEGDQSLEYWRDVHWRYFTKEAAQLDVEFHERSLICCERFELLYH